MLHSKPCNKIWWHIIIDEENKITQFHMRIKRQYVSFDKIEQILHYSLL